MSVQNGERLVTKQDLADMYQGILPYLGGMPEVLANKFSKGDMYSTDEKMIGQWIDGKPLYQLVVPYSFTGVTARTYTNILDLTSYNIDTFVNAKGYIINSNSDVKTKSFPLADQNNRINAVYDRTTKYLQLLTYEVNGWILSGHVIVQYTKTTDSAISIGNDTDYSTEEKIVGTWIDGKPIYQKTIYESSITIGSSWQRVGDDMPNIDNIIDFRGTMKTSSDIYFLCYFSGESASYIASTFDRNNNKIAIKSGASKTGALIITIQYTKTTD